MHRLRPGRLIPAAVVLIGAAILPMSATASGSTDSGNDIARKPPVAASTEPTTPSRPLSSSAVGALFQPGRTSHFCTAAVVDSPHGNVVVTAAHCLAGTGIGLRFVPGYGPSGSGPAGAWVVTGAYTDPAWLSDQDIRHDYAFLTVSPADGAPAGRTVQSVVGAVGALSRSLVVDQPVELAGYTDGSNDQPVTCAVQPTSTPDGGAGSPTVSCPGFRAGTSGSPWVQQVSGKRRLVGLVGGLHQGGCSDDVSHSPAFDSSVTAVLARASSGGPSDTFPVPDDDGC